MSKCPNMWTLFTNQWVKKKSKQKFLERNKNQNTTHQNLWDATKTALWTDLQHRRLS